MDYLFSIFLGIIQGLTEFLPISSSGHLILFHQIFQSELLNNLTFDVFLHAGTLIALIIFFFRDLVRYIVAFFRSLENWNLNDFDQRIAWFILMASIPTFIAGYLLQETVAHWFRSPYLVAVMLIVFGIILFIIDRVARKIRDLESATFTNVLTVGLAQILALIPGVSRSGITIIAGLSVGLKRHEAARLAFLMAIPVIAGATVKTIFDLEISVLTSQEIFLYLIGFISAFISGFFCIKFFFKFLQRHSFSLFAFYRVILGIIIIIILLV